MFESIFSGTVWIDKLHNCLKEFVSLAMVIMEPGKRRILRRQKTLQQ